MRKIISTSDYLLFLNMQKRLDEAEYYKMLNRSMWQDEQDPIKKKEYRINYLRWIKEYNEIFQLINAIINLHEPKNNK